MKIVGDEIDVIVKFKRKTKPIPLKFGIHELEGNPQIIKVDKILYTEEEKLAGIRAYVYRCQSMIDGELKLYELKYYIQDCRWVLYKI
jgi:hypothetical protein